jgi:hypothetical protein
MMIAATGTGDQATILTVSSRFQVVRNSWPSFSITRIPLSVIIRRGALSPDSAAASDPATAVDV